MGLKWEKTKFDCVCVSVVFPFIPLVFYSPFVKPMEWDVDVEVLACFKPGFMIHSLDFISFSLEHQNEQLGG